jgi:predicted anti-sigma-YlaC factor YlaD
MTAHLAAYFEGFQAVLETALADEPTDAMHLRWCTEMRDCVSRCATLYREERVAEIQKANIFEERAS